VTAETPKSLPPMAKDLPRNRFGLAKWLLAKEHPLTTRVTVNRFWQDSSATGSSRRAATSASPAIAEPPELLDWLCVRVPRADVASAGA